MASLLSSDHRLLFNSELRMELQFCTEGMTEFLGFFTPLLPTPLLGQSLHELLMLLGYICT